MKMAGTLGDILVRLKVFEDADALDFKKTRRAVFIVEDNIAELPLPTGERGEKGDKGDPGGPLAIRQVLNHQTDSEALGELQEKSRLWSNETRQKNIQDGYFVVNEPTKTGFAYTLNGWSIITNVFGGSPGLLAPGTYHNVTSEPDTPSSGVVVYAQNNELWVKKPDGSKVKLA